MCGSKIFLFMVFNPVLRLHSSSDVCSFLEHCPFHSRLCSGLVSRPCATQGSDRLPFLLSTCGKDVKLVFSNLLEGWKSLLTRSWHGPSHPRSAQSVWIAKVLLAWIISNTAGRCILQRYISTFVICTGRHWASSSDLGKCPGLCSIQKDGQYVCLEQVEFCV